MVYATEICYCYFRTKIDSSQLNDSCRENELFGRKRKEGRKAERQKKKERKAEQKERKKETRKTKKN